MLDFESSVWPSFWGIDPIFKSISSMKWTTEYLHRAVKSSAIFVLFLLFNATRQKFEKYCSYPGLGTEFFPVQKVLLFPALLKNVLFFPILFWVFGDLWDPKERNILSHSFEKNGKERKERPVPLQRMGKNTKIIPFFYKERRGTRERSVLLQKNPKCSVLSSIYIYRYI